MDDGGWWICCVRFLWLVDGEEFDGALLKNGKLYCVPLSIRPDPPWSSTLQFCGCWCSSSSLRSTDRDVRTFVRSLDGRQSYTTVASSTSNVP